MRNIHKLFKAVVFVFGMLLLAGSIAEAQIAVSLPTVTGPVNVTKLVPISVGAITAGQNVKSFSFTLTYDQTAVNIDTVVVTAGMLANAFAGNIAINTTVPGKITVAGAGASALAGVGSFIGFNMKPLKTGTWALTLTSFTFNDGVPAVTITSGVFNIPAVSFNIPDTTARQPIGGALSIPVKTDDLTSSNVKAYVFTVTYNPALINITDVSTTGTLSAGWSVDKNVATPGKIIVSGANAVKMSGKGVVINLIGTAVAGGTTALALSNVVLNDGTPAIGTIDGSIVITVNAKPTFAVISPVSKNELDTVKIVVSATDSNISDVLTYSAIGLPVGATFTAATRTFSWVPALKTAGSYSVTFVVTDGQLTDTAKAAITITKNNLKPVFVSRIPVNQDSVQLNYSFKLNFKVLATDANGDALTYTWKLNNAVAKTGTDSTYAPVGVFTALGQQRIVCVFSDGALSDSSVWTFNVVTKSTAVENMVSGVPTEFSLGQNYPNPFNPSTTISFGLPMAAPVTLEIYSILGAKVRTLISGSMMSAAYHNVAWDGKNDAGSQVTSGMYLYRIVADKHVSTMKMLLMK